MVDDHHKHHTNKKILLISFLIISLYTAVEIIGGFLTNSLALLSDAGHMLSDSFSLGIALFALILSGKFTGEKKTYGNKRFEILAALVNGILLLLVSGFIFYEAVERFKNPPEIATAGMLIISVIGLLVNILVAWIMHRSGDTKENLNMRGAFLHVLSDLFGSIGAISAAILIMLFGWTWADAVASLIVALLVLRSGILITRDSLHIMMERAPKNIDLKKVIAEIKSEEKIVSLHDLHLWTITSGFHALTCHAVVSEELGLKESTEMLKRIEEKLHALGIIHVTIQIETANHGHSDSLFCCTK